MPIHNTGRAARFAEMLDKYRRGEFVDDTVPPICGACKKEERPGQVEYPFFSLRGSQAHIILPPQPLIRCSGCDGVQYCNAKVCISPIRSNRWLKPETH